MAISVRPSREEDIDSIHHIYSHYIAPNGFNLEEAVPTRDEMVRRREKVLGRSLPWLVATVGDQVVGYSYADLWNERSGYRFSVTDSIYIHPDSCGKGIGSMLLSELLRYLKARGIKQIIAVVFSRESNPCSHKLHEKFGFAQVGLLRGIGFKNGEWVDIAHLQLTLEETDTHNELEARAPT